ncbi:hypothetical protein F2S72_01755 [Pseudomonas syringae pv. actinidiae]|nr:hypothetical protein [Pseudomonas syringae pv. actinidiae]
MATWIDNLREWNYDIGPVFNWLMDTIDYQAARYGPVAYVVAVLIVVFLLLSFPPTRGLTKAMCSVVFKEVMSFVKLVSSLLTVHFVSWMARFGLTLFHKARIWVIETYRRARE